MKRLFIPSPFASQRGLTLIELMIGMALGLIVLAGIGYIYLGSRQTYKLQDNMARIQENGRYAMEILGREIRMAGFQECSTAKFTSTVNPQAGAQNNYLYDFSRNPIEGFNAIPGTSTWTTVTSGSPATTVSVSNVASNVVSGTDVIALRSTGDLGIQILGQPTDNNCGDTTADLKVTNNSVLSDGMIVMSTNCTNATVFQITNFNSNQNVVHNTGTASPGNSTKDLGACFVGGNIVAVSAVSYFIRNNIAGVPALFRKRSTDVQADELVEGIEDMQIEYGIDTNGDGAVDEYVNAGQANKLDTADRWSKVLSVRISLVLVSREDGVLDAPQQYVFNGNPVNPTGDRRLRFVFTSTIGVRNRLL